MLTEGDIMVENKKRRIKINPANRGKTRATTKKNKDGKLSLADLKRQKAKARTTKRKRQLQFAINVRQGKIGGGRKRRRR